MTNKSLPRKLGKEPLIDVVCEVRFEATAPASSLLPGLILTKLGDRTYQFEALPASQLPQAIREQDRNFDYAALMRIVVDNQFAVLVSDKSLAVACKIPYAGWQEFKRFILSVFSVLAEAGFVQKIQRHSLKYVDLFDREDGGEPTLNRFNISLDIADTHLSNEILNLRTEISAAPFIHALTIVSPATVKTADGSQRQGAVLDVDTHRIEEYLNAKEFCSQLPALLEHMHDANKSFFFSLLSPSGLAKLDPIYE